MARLAGRHRLLLTLSVVLLWWPGVRLGQDVSFAAPKKQQAGENRCCTCDPVVDFRENDEGIGLKIT